MKTLQQIAEEQGTDKADHGYCEIYEKHTNHLRDAPIRVLEIGVYYGASLRMWREYFTEAKIHGADIDVKRCGDIDGVELHGLNVDDHVKLESLSATHGPFDIIIDDASHTMKHQQKTFNVLWPRLAPGGLYIIEDLHTSFFPKLDSHSACSNDEHNKTTTFRMVEMLKEGKSWSGRYTKAETFESFLETVDHVTIWVRKPAQFSHELTSDGNSATSIIRKKRT